MLRQTIDQILKDAELIPKDHLSCEVLLKETFLGEVCSLFGQSDDMKKVVRRIQYVLERLQYEAEDTKKLLESIQPPSSTDNTFIRQNQQLLLPYVNPEIRQRAAAFEFFYKSCQYVWIDQPFEFYLAGEEEIESLRDAARVRLNVFNYLPCDSRLCD